MKKVIGLVSLFLTTFHCLDHPSKAKDLTPYQTVVLASAVNYCTSEYGLITEKQAYRYIVHWAKEDHGLEPYQVYNLTQKKSFPKDTDKLIDAMGGCKTIAAEVKEELNRKPTGFAALKDSKKEYEYYYKIWD